MTGVASPGAHSFTSRPSGGSRTNAGPASDSDAIGGDGPQPVRVLLIDDPDREAREIVAALTACDRRHVRVDHVSDPKEAEHLWFAGKHDLVIVDVWLGRSISAELMSLLTAGPTSCPIVMLSSLSADELVSYFTDSDLFIHSKNDITPSALLETLEAALASEVGQG